MRSVSNSFQETVRGSHNVKFRARLCPPGQTGTNPSGTEIPVLTGDVTFDSSADVIGSVSLTTSYDWPLMPGDFGTPYGFELFLAYAVSYNGTDEYVSLGYFRVNDIKQSQYNDTIDITATDRMSYVQDARFTQTLQFGADASVQAVIDFLVTDAYADAEIVYEVDLSTTLLGAAQTTPDENRLGFLQQIVASQGLIMQWRYDGKLYIQVPPSPSNDAVYTVDSGRNGVLTGMARELSRDGVYNIVVARGDPIGTDTGGNDLPPVQAIAEDTNPDSPTFIDLFGKVSTFFNSSFLVTVDQCQATADSMLLQSVGLPYTLSITAIANPALEVFDVINVKYNEHDPIETHIIDKLTIPLDIDGDMSIDTRKQFLGGD